MTPYEAYAYAYNNYNAPGFDLEYYQKIACQHAGCAYLFALRIPGANIEYCQKYACTSCDMACYFAEFITDANLQYCRQICEQDYYWLNEIDKIITIKAML